ncbi:hypothetical protein [Puniceibacterium sediminis]|uniref:MarR family transcriptional regulator n=1 Tax=Puniceibacterium sediminis TaxID=1608407 RepID=A0A238VIP0_9RHOB|nr:hypothetical protein [Puniceibacterium sediminis]SNR33563.1 hypothetical protein SAMN06265370_102150 [Puniceibacterium sediminis]
MEHDSGLMDLTRNERDILLAFHANAVTDPEQGMLGSTDKVRLHPTVVHMSQPTFHRTLKRLINRGFVRHVQGLPSGTYKLTEPETVGSY